MKKLPESESIKSWYKSNYPTDELGDELNDVTFDELFNALDRKKNVYEFIGLTDSMVRERLFERLAGISEMPYSYIYDQWLLA